ncbi:MAG TPA: carbohydrate ABC transporter permease [Candidatus Dormibacteraeota bacterium]|nr:carbohydrate ABC transporter permease [Candidatus Dormibacteraeota bacterium]
MSTRPMWMERPRPSTQVIKAIILVVVVLLVVLPFVSIIATSLASQKQVAESGGLVILPTHPTLGAYQDIFQGGVVTRAIIVSGGITVVGTLLSLIVTAALAYALSRPGVFAARPVLLLVLATLFFAPGIIPVYLVVKELGLLGTYASLILPVLVGAFNVVVMRAFFMGIPQEVLDSARIDGASEVTTLTRIVLPLSKAVMAVIGLFYAVSYWNAFFQALLYLNNTAMWPLQLVLRLYVLQGEPLPGSTIANEAGVPPPAESIQMAVVVIATIPILIVYPFLQRYFSRGVLTGAIKG